MRPVVAVSVSSFAESDPAPLEMLRSAGVEVRANPFGRRLSEEEAIAHLKGVHGLLAGLEPLNRRVLSSAGELKALARVGIGMDNVDEGAARELGIKVSNTPSPPVDAVAELTVAALLALSRRLVETDARMHAGSWTKLMGSGVAGSRVLIIGCGRIGRRVAQILKVLKAEVGVCDPFATLEGARAFTLEEGLGWADAVTLHASGKERLLGAGELSLMRRGALLLNCARGGLVDEAALAAALHSGAIGGAWVDTFSEEPYSGPLTDCSNALLTPHVATYTESCRRAMETEAVANLLRDLGIAG